MSAKHSRNQKKKHSHHRARRPQYRLLAPQFIFDLALEPGDDELFSIQVYAAAFFLLLSDFHDLVGPASLTILDECASAFSQGHKLTVAQIDKVDMVNMIDQLENDFNN